jgi:VIT1/CCC1 family predicted Fe2+/Mn2+ transporter/rubrerythrin
MATAKDLKRWLAQWQDEGDAHFLYQVLAALEPNPSRQEILHRLAVVEHRHQEAYARLLRSHGQDPGQYRPSLHARMLAWLAKHGAAQAVMRVRLTEEANEVKQFLQATGRGERLGLGEQTVRDEAQHAQVLRELLGRGPEPWHHIESGGFLRNAVYGFNDGLTANFGLVMGVVGAQVASQVVLLAGLAGLVADALSMGSSSYLAAKSEQEVYQHEIELEREELKLMPALELEELALLYEAKGLAPALARQLAEQMLANPEMALQEKVHEELGIGMEFVPPLQQGVLTGVATAFGALIPIIPYLVLSDGLAMGVSFVISMLSHFVIGAARSVFTGRNAFRSGLDMFLVGLGVAVVGYIIGYLLTGHIAG